MDGLSQETLAFLIDIQEHGANQLRALSADFNQLGVTADRIGKQLTTLQGQLDRAAASSAAAGEKVATSARAAAGATEAQTKAAADLETVQKRGVASADAVSAANERLAKAQGAAAGAAGRDAAAQDKQAGAAKRAEGATVAATGASTRHGRALDEHASKLKRVEQGLGNFGRAMNNVSLPIVAVSGYAIKMGLDFEAAMERLHVQAGYAQKDIAGLEKAVLKAAPHLARTPNELAEALYHVASVGIPAANAMQVVSAAAIAANIGNANLEHTTNGLVIVMKSLHQPASMAKEDMAVLNEIVGAGNLRMEDLVTSLGKVLPQAQNFGLGLRDVGAALDVMTSRGINAQMAATRLGMTFNLMGNPSVTAQKALDTIGLSSTALATDMRKPNGLLLAVEDLKKHLDATFPASSGRKLTVEQERQALQTYKKSLEEAGVSGTKLTKQLEEYAAKLVHMGSAAVQQSQVLSSAFGRGRQSATILTLVQNLDDLRRMYGRLPEGAKALARLTDAQDQWEKTSSAQFDTAKATISAAMTEIGKSLGPVVVPVIKDLATDVSDLVQAFEKLPKPFQHVIEEGTALVAVLGPAALLMSKLIGAGRALGGLGSTVAHKLGYGGAAADVVAGETGVAGVAQKLAGGGIFGVLGPAEPGSRLNPIAVMVLGQTGGLPFGSGSGALSQAERDAAAAEQRTPGGVLLPRGVSAGVLAEDAAGAAGAVGIGSKILTIGKGLAGGVLKGGGIALGGMALADITGSIVGGKTGSAISSIGSDAAIGAGLGSLIGPEGTVIGAVGGALVGGLGKLFSEPSLGQKVADQIGKGFEPAIKKVQADAINAAVSDPTGHGTLGKVQLAGQATAAGVEHAVSSGVRFLEVGAIVRQVEQRFKNIQLPTPTGTPAMVTREMQEQANLNKMMPQFREAGIKSIIEFTAGMQAQGRLPQGATDQLIKELEKKWPGLSDYLHQIGMSSMRELTKTIENRQAVQAAGQLVQQIKQEFGGEFGKLAAELKNDGGDMSRQWGTTLEFLLGQTHSKMPQVREAAEHDLQALKGNSAKIVGGWVQQLTEQLHKGGANAVSNFQGSMSNIVVVIKTLMEKGIISTKEGMAAISKVTHTELKELGAAPTKAEVQKSHAFGAGVEPGNQPSGFPFGATGMRVPGPVGPDNVGVYSPGGRLRGVVAGGELLVANRHTEDRVNRMLAPFGTSLGAEVAGEHRPHSAPRAYATGGRFVPEAGTNFSVGKEPQIVTDLRRMAEAMNWTVYGISGYRSPAHSLAVGGFANDPHTRGEAADIGINSPTLASAAALTAAILARFGLERPFYPASAHEINHVQLLGSGVPGGARESVAALAAAASRHAHAIHMPAWQGPGGDIGRIGHAALARAVKAANARIASVAGAAGGSLAGFHGGGSPSANEALGRKMMLAYGWSASEWPFLQALWTQESGWSDTSVNPSSGAYGIPQALGHGHPYNLGDAPAQIRWGLHYIKERYGSPSAAEAHEKADNWYDRGGRMRYAGAFGHGGVATASTPTMAVFGDRGPETAIFVPHAETGNQLLEEIGVTPTPPKVPAGQKVVEGLNPDNNEIEYHTEAEWKSIRLRHEQAAHRKTAKGKTPEVEEAVRLGGMDVGAILSKSSTPIDIPRDVAHLSAQTWKKVVTAIEHTLKETGGPANAAFDVQAVGRLARDAHGPRMHALAGAAIQQSAKTIMTVTKNLPEEQQVSGADAAVGQLRQLISDARRSANRNLIGALTKDIEKTLKGAGAAILHQVANAPSSGAERAAASGVRQLYALVSKARANGAHSVELALFKDIQKTIAGWQSAIQASLSASQGRTTAKENVKIALANLARIRAGGGGAKLVSSGTDASFLKQEEADQEAAIAEYTHERAQLAALVKHLQAAMHKQEIALRRAIKRHHRAQARALEAEIKEIQAQVGSLEQQMGEVSTDIGEATANIAQLQIEFAQHVYEEVKARISEAEERFTHVSNMLSIRTQTEEQEEHNAGTDLSGLQEDANKQGGVLTPGQVAQAQKDAAEFKRRHEEQIKADEQARNYDISQLPNLTGSDREKMEETIAQLGLTISQLQGAIVDNQKATEQLTQATKASTNTMAQFTGSVTFQYQNQQYVVGQTSDLAHAPAVGM